MAVQDDKTFLTRAQKDPESSPLCVSVMSILTVVRLELLRALFVFSVCSLGTVWTQVATESAARVVKYCVPYDQPPAFAELCTKTLEVANTNAVRFECVSGGSFETMIHNGEAELTTADGGDAFWAHSEYAIEPLLYENYGNGVGTEYYAVAVVPRSFCNASVSVGSLRGLRSCHTGYRKTAGWFMPLGTLLDQDLVKVVDVDGSIENDAETMKSFFSEICASRVSGNGPRNGEGNVGESWAPLCTSCAGDCSTHDKYYDYHGAFRCLMEDAGDVAFVKHSTVLNFARDGVQPMLWADKNISDFQLLCKEGGCMDPEDYKDCHWARVPAHSIVADSSMTFQGFDFEFGRQIQEALVAAIENKPGFLRSLIELVEQENVILKAGTVLLNPVFGMYESTVGEGALAAYQGVSELFQD